MVVQTSKTSNLLVIPFLLVFLNYSFYCYSQPQIINYTKEKIYLDIDKSDFYTGENIWFKAYLIDSKTHSSETLSKVVYVELIAPNGSILSRKRIKITNGGGHGDFKLGSKLESGAYTIRAYTNYIRNFDQTYFFRKTISINTLKSEVCSFFSTCSVFVVVSSFLASLHDTVVSINPNTKIPKIVFTVLLMAFTFLFLNS